MDFSNLANMLSVGSYQGKIHLEHALLCLLHFAELLNRFKVLSLGDLRKYLSLCTMYEVVNELLYFRHDAFVPRTTTLRSSSKLIYHQPFTHTNNAFLHSIVPKTCSA